MTPVHAHEGNGAVPAGGGRMPDRLRQEPCESLRGHFAGSHGELAMTHPAEAADMTVDRHVVGWVRDPRLLLSSASRSFGRPASRRTGADDDRGARCPRAG